MKNWFNYLFAVCILILLLTPLTIAQSNDPFNGSFGNAEIRLTMQGSNNQYQGSVQFDGQTCRVVARKVNANTISGSYHYQGQNLPFQAVINRNTLTIYSQGATYTLQRIGQAIGPGGQPGSQVLPNPRPQNQNLQNQVSGSVRNDEWGMTFTPPPGWTPKMTDSGYLLGSNTLKGLILILPNEARTLQQVRTGAQQGIVEGNTRLTLSGSLQNFGQNGLAGTFKGVIEGQQAHTYAVGLISPYGPGAVALVAVTPGSFTAKHTQSLNQLAKSIRFYKPPVSPAALQWKQALNNCKLSYFSRYSSGGSGYTSETGIDLCAKGFFRYGNQDESVLNAVPGNLTGGYSMSYGKGSGTWSVINRGQNIILVLKYYNNKVSEYTLTTDDKQRTYLNGKRWLRTCNPNDQVVEARPDCW